MFRYEAAKARLKREEEEITKMLKERDEEYEKLYESCYLPYANTIAQISNQKTSTSFFTSLFGGSSGNGAKKE